MLNMEQTLEPWSREEVVVGGRLLGVAELQQAMNWDCVAFLASYTCVCVQYMRVSATVALQLNLAEERSGAHTAHNRAISHTQPRCSAFLPC